MENWSLVSRFQLVKHFESGLWYEDIARIYGVSESAVYKICKKLNLNYRKNPPKNIELKTCIHCGKQYKTSKNEGFCSNNCKTLYDKIQNGTLLENIDISKIESELGKKIIELRKQGISYKKIADKLGCSKATISYWCSENTKEKTKDRLREYRKTLNGIMSDRVFSFKEDRYKRRKGKQVNMCKDWKKKLYNACLRFKNSSKDRNKNNMEETTKYTYTYKDALNHLVGSEGGYITKCYLTGREIDIMEDDFNLDHIVPVSKGGTCELSNMGITIPVANQMKTNLQLDEFFDLCKEILEYNGYTVTKDN